LPVDFDQVGGIGDGQPGRGGVGGAVETRLRAELIGAVQFGHLHAEHIDGAAASHEDVVQPAVADADRVRIEGEAGAITGLGDGGCRRTYT